MGRVAAYLIFVFAALGLLAARSVYGDVGESSMIVGRELSGMKDLLGGSHLVQLNGEQIFVSEATVPGTVKGVLDRFEQLCRKDSHGLDLAVADPEHAFPEGMTKLIAGVGPAGLGILRREEGGDGALGCLAQPGSGVTDLSRRLISFSQSLDLGDVGKLRYVYVKPSSAGRVQVITAWTDGSFRVGRLVPANGQETPGSDPTAAPRPEHATRLLTASVDKAPYGLRIYDVAAPLADALRDYDAGMARGGWSAADAVSHEAPNARAYSRGGVDVLLFAERDGQRTSFSLIEMASKAPLGLVDSERGGRKERRRGFPRGVTEVKGRSR